jgi:putative tryptophan/tyrosine transport system substrate-binding protein
MRRREFISLIVGAIAPPLPGGAQQPMRMPTVGILALGAPPRTVFIQSLLQGLRDLGWIEGQNIVIETRWAATVDLLSRAASELVEMKVDVIFASNSTYVEAARLATNTIPIVFSNHADPVGVGHVASLAHPGGNITGISMLLTELAAKQLEVLQEAVAGATRIGVLRNPTTPSHRPALKSIEAAGDKLRIHVQMVPVRTADEFEAAMSTMKQSSAEAFLDVASPLTFMQRARLVESALKFRLPGMFGYRQTVEAGGLMSYAADNTQLHRHAAVYVDKILKGEKPVELPVEQAAQYELVINLKTAKALGLTIPPALLARADEVIE